MFTHFLPGDNFTDIVLLSTTQKNYDLYSALGDPAEPRNILLTIDAGIIIDSSSAGTAAFSTGSGWAAGTKIKIINNGQIIGKGGAGGAGGTAGNYFANAGAPGSAGGPAMDIQINIALDNTNGDIFGGGGGGGGGGGYVRRQVGGTPEIACGGGGGGGGAGDDPSSGGAGGIGQEPTDFGSPNGAAGSAGTTLGGAGGIGASVSGEPSPTTGDGGAGGGYGDVGNPGLRPDEQTLFTKIEGAGGAAGAAGKAIDLNGNAVTWLGGNNPTQVKGAVS